MICLVYYAGFLLENMILFVGVLYRAPCTFIMKADDSQRGTVKPILWYIFFPPAIKLCHQSERVLADSPSATAAVMHCYHIFKTNLMVSFSTS